MVDGKCVLMGRSKQYYQYIQKEWMDGDPGQPAPPPERKWVRNRVSKYFCRFGYKAHGQGMEAHVH